MWHCCKDVEQEVEQKSWKCNKACGTGAEITGARLGSAVLQQELLLQGWNIDVGVALEALGGG